MLAYTGNPLDRKTECRIDEAYVAERRSADDTRFLPFCEGNPLAIGDKTGAKPGFLSARDCALAPEDATIFLGLRGGSAYFAFDIGPDPTRREALGALGQFVDLRWGADVMALDDVAIAAQAKALIEWHTRSRFCPRCGRETISGDGGNKRVCPGCHTEHFPRTDPAVIMLVTRGDKCLLARNAKWITRPRFSTLAGFVEPGESLEDAVRREVREEVGVHVGAVRYFASQPWPYPGALMLGYYAECDEEAFRLDPNEIAEARWFTRTEAQALLDGRLEGTSGPMATAIAHALISGWIANG